jgi:hypothetical protein
MIRRATLIVGVTLLAAVWLGAGAAAPARASTRDDAMRQAVMALRGLIDRQGAAHFFEYPTRREVRDGGGLSNWWPSDPWTGGALSPGSGVGHYRYTTTRDRRHYRLVGYLPSGGTVVATGGMPHEIMLAYDHRGEEGVNLIRQYIEDYAAAHHGLYPAPADVAADGAVGMEPARRYWPSNPWDHAVMTQRNDHGSFAYSVAPDRLSYTLSLHRALKHDYVLGGIRATSPWQVLLTSLEDRILRRDAHVLAGYVVEWAQRHGGEPPKVAELAPGAAVGAAHPDWPVDPVSGAAMRPGTTPGDYTYAPGPGAAYRLTVHLHSGDVRAGGLLPPATPPWRASGTTES